MLLQNAELSSHIAIVTQMLSVTKNTELYFINSYIFSIINYLYFKNCSVLFSKIIRTYMSPKYKRETGRNPCFLIIFLMLIKNAILS